MWAGRAARWPKQPPATREYYLLRSIFEEHFPSPCALATVPMARPLPCSMAAPTWRLASKSLRCLAQRAAHCWLCGRVYVVLGRCGTPGAA
jgi:hypothetical protein